MDIATALYGPTASGAPRTYGPFSLNGLTDATTDRIEWTMSFGADYPTDPTREVFRIKVEYGGGLGAAEWTYNGGLRDRLGNALTSTRGAIPVFTTAGKKNAVVDARCTVVVSQPFTAAISINAVDAA